MPITALPTPPSRNDPSNFATRADAFLGALPTFATEANALASEVNADEAAAAVSAALAEDWANQVGAAVSGGEYSSKEYANGTAAPTGSAKNWATKTGSVVADSEYSAKEYATGTSVPAGSAKNWATKTDGPVAGSEYSAKKYAQDASDSADAASASASAASASAAAAAASAENIELGEKLNLGAKASNPTVDNQGDPLTPGAIYYNTTVGETRQWTGTVWKATGSSVNGTASRQTYTATAGQTTFSITYDVGFIDVYLNGVKQVSGTDFTATNGTSVVFASALAAGDIVDMVAFGVFSIASEALNVQVVSSNTNALAYRVYVLTASLTLTLPESPSPGQYVRISNASGTTTCVVARNGSNIMGLAENLTLDAINASLTLMYADATRGWVFI